MTRSVHMDGAFRLENVKQMFMFVLFCVQIAFFFLWGRRGTKALYRSTSTNIHCVVYGCNRLPPYKSHNQWARSEHQESEERTRIRHKPPFGSTEHMQPLIDQDPFLVGKLSVTDPAT